MISNIESNYEKIIPQNFDISLKQNIKKKFAQLAGAVEYTNCFSVEREDFSSPPPTSV